MRIFIFRENNRLFAFRGNGSNPEKAKNDFIASGSIENQKNVSLVDIVEQTETESNDDFFDRAADTLISWSKRLAAN